MNSFARFGFLVLGLLGLLCTHARAGAADWQPGMAIQTWTVRNLNFEQALQFASSHGYTNLQLSGVQLNPKAPREENEKKKAYLASTGIKVYGFGVNDTTLDKEENRKLFEFAKFMGMELIVVEPQDFKIWDNLEELAKEYDLRVAVHNHGILSLYGNPAVVRNILKGRDRRLGVCLDVGWVTAAGFDAAKVFAEYEGRVFDIHLKDKRAEKVKEGADVWFDTMIGEGQANLKGLYAKLKEARWPGYLALETDSPEFARKPEAFVDGATSFIWGRMAAK